jgi:hypothetical protein
MLKRLAIYCMALLIAGAAVVGYYWFRERQLRAETARELQPFFDEEIAQKKALESLGDIDLNPRELNIENLEQKLQQPIIKRIGSHNTTQLGWACGRERCVIWAWFLVPFGQEIPPKTAPVALIVMSPPFTNISRLTVGGIHLGGTVEEMEKSCQQRGFGQSLGHSRISWDQDWNLVWSDTKDKVGLLSFTNATLIKNADASRDVNSPSVDSIRKKGEL